MLAEAGARSSKTTFIFPIHGTAASVIDPPAWCGASTSRCWRRSGN
jgi:hypothetical protein